VITKKKNFKIKKKKNDDFFLIIKKTPGRIQNKALNYSLMAEGVISKANGQKINRTRRTPFSL